MKKNKLCIAAVAMLLLNHYVSAQTPGGVPLNAWYKADGSGLYSDAGVTPVVDNVALYQWNSEVGSFPMRQTNSLQRPIYSNATNLANFNPSVTFDGVNDYIEFVAGAGVNIIDRADGTIYASGFVNNLKRNGFAGFHATMDYPGLHIFSTNYELLFFTGGPGYQGLSPNNVMAKTFFSAGSGWINGGGSSSSYANATVSLSGMRNDYSGTQLYNANLSDGARNFRIGADNNYGAFDGQLNEVMIYENKLTHAEMDRVETYLAIKYGFTYAEGGSNYVSSDGTIVWDATTNAGYHNNIAGIARDINGALNQKQSWSTNPGKQLLIGTTGLANTNMANSESLLDGQYLIWGDNAGSKALTVPIAGIADISHRFGAIWKVQNSNGVGVVRVAWPKGIANIALMQSDDNVFDASDIISDMSANEMTINGEVYNYVDVTLSDGEYFTIIGKAIAPGGVVDGLLMWHKADDQVTTPGPKDVWYDISGNNRDVTQTNSADNRPLLVTDASYNANSTKYSFNFNPFYYFDGTNDFFYNLGVDYFPATNSPGSVYGVIHNSAVGGWRTPYGWGDDDPNLVRGNNNYYFTRDNGTFINTGNIGLEKMPAHIGSLIWKGATNGLYLCVDGRTFYANTNIGSINSGNNFAIGSEGWALTSNGYEVHQGGISEVFAYSIDHKNSSNNELLRINTYLAIKYGITLKDSAGTNTPNYLNSNSDIVWNSTLNSGYNNNIAGIARDDNSGLLQKQSQSNQKGQQVLIGTTGLNNTNQLNAVDLSEGQFLIWGDNGLAKVPAVAISGVSDVNFRFASVWKVQNTGSVGTVRVAWPTGLTNISLLQSSDPTFATVDAATNMASNIITINGVVYNYADVTLEDGEYFTFGAQLNGPGGVALDLRVWLRSDAGFSPEEWTDLSGNSNNYTQAHETRQPFLSSQMYNFNPIVDFGTTGADARFMVLPVGKPYSANGTNSTLFTATISRSQSGYSDIIGFGGTTTGSGLANADEPTFTKLNNNLILYPYTTAPDYDPVVLNRLYLDDVSFTVGVSGIKYGNNGALDTVANIFTAANADFADGSILGAQPQERNGCIGEVIAYERDLTEDEKQKVRTYVAIKYGITLSHNYIASDGTIIWDLTANTGYNNNIAGIVRDDYGSLNQKQSKSINTSNQVLISTIGLAESNSTNTSMLNDQQSLIWGDNGLTKGPSVAIAGIPDVNNRFGSIWKVQNTGSVGTVRVAWQKGLSNLKLIQSADDVIDASDVITDMNNEITIAGITYVYADVTLEDGEYFTFAAFVQSPGGVETPVVWLKANLGTNTVEDDAEVTDWINYGSVAGIAEPLHPVNGTPNFISNAHNFNPAIEDNTTGIHDGLVLKDVFPSYAHRDLSTFVIQSQPNVAAQRTMISFGNNSNSSLANDVPWFAGESGRLHFWWEGSYNGTPIIPGLASRSNNVPSINAYYLPEWVSNPHTTTISLNGSTANATGSSNALLGVGHNLFIHGDGGNNNISEGQISEIISYDRMLTDNEKLRINTYLAIKYGITLLTSDGLNASHYITSNSDTIYYSETLYKYNVAGIGHDYNSALHQKQSTSQHPNTNSQVIIGLGEIAVDNISNLNNLEDGQFLVWGDNGNTQAMSGIVGTYTEFEYAGSTDNGRRMNRVWKVQNTNVNQEVMIRFPQASVGTTTLPDETCAEYVLIVADDADFTTNVQAKILGVDDLDYVTSYKFQNGFSYFTFARVRPVNLGDIFLPETIEVTATYDDVCTFGEWTYFHREGDASQKLFAAAGFTTAEMDLFEVTITPEGVDYDLGSRTTKVMPRITTVTDGGATYAGMKKVRIYYSSDELDATIVPGYITNTWIKYNGTAEEVLADIYSDGIFDESMATILVPDAFGIENGVNYVEFHNITSFSSFLFISSTENAITLPVKWISFTATAQNNNAVLLEWNIGKEQNCYGYEVEHSLDGREWKTLEFIEAKDPNGTNMSILDYLYVHTQPTLDNNYYRIKQIDVDGKYEYSVVRLVKMSDGHMLSVVPNPTNGLVTINGLPKGKTQIVVVNSIGQLLLNTTVENANHYKLDLSRFAAGSYYISVYTEGREVSNLKVIKQ